MASTEQVVERIARKLAAEAARRAADWRNFRDAAEESIRLIAASLVSA